MAGGNSRKMRELTAKRAVAAMPVAGSYRAIDFVLSNMTNSHIQKVAVLTQYNARSLNEHLNSSKWWDFGRKQGGLFVFTPTITADNGYWYRGTADAIYQNLDFLKPEVRNYFFRELPSVYSKVSDQPPAKYNPGAVVKNSLIGSGSIVNGTIENSVIFKKVFVGNNCVIKNSIILNDVYLGDNTYIENCIVESRDTIRANTRYVGENGVKVVVEKNERYAL